MANKKNIAIITTVSNWELFDKTKEFFPLGIRIFTIDGTTRFYGLKSLLFSIEKLKKYQIDWLIMADEDVVFTSPEKVFDLIEYLDREGYTVCGMRDGGALSWRDKNPNVINHFFAVLNLKEIHNIFNRKEILGNQYIDSNEFDLDHNKLPFGNYNEESLAEPYYCFYLWLKRLGKKFKYLEAENPISGDFATTVLKDADGDPFLYHTWYARFYGLNKFHTNRINNVINFGEKVPENLRNRTTPIELKKPFYDIKFFIYKYTRKVLRKFNSNNR